MAASTSVRSCVICVWSAVFDVRRELPLHGAHSRARRRGGAGIDQVGDGFRLRDVDFAVQEGSFR